MLRSLRKNLASPLIWGMLGAVLFGTIGAAYGGWLYHSPEYREAYVRETLSQPHMDSPRYLAGIVAWRYRTLGSLLCQYGLSAALSGFAVGVFAGLYRKEIRERDLESVSKKRTLPFSLVELLAAIAIVGILVMLLMPRNYGLVYFQGKDQFHWLMLLENGDETEQREAVAAFCEILKEQQFPCRSTIIPALANAGLLAEPAIPVLEELSKDEELAIREPAVQALETIRASGVVSR